MNGLGHLYPAESHLPSQSPEPLLNPCPVAGRDNATFIKNQLQLLVLALTLAYSLSIIQISDLYQPPLTF